jgi:hypothetical protein
MNKRIEEIFQQVMNEACPDPLRRFAELVAQDEREACAKLCEPTPLRPCDCYSCDCGDKDAAVRVAEWDLQWSMAKTIRQRGEK